MKKTLCSLLFYVSIASCVKVPSTPKPDITGKWCFVEDTTRCVNVSKVNDTTTEITFANRIEAPKAGPITMTYKTVTRDTVFCKFGWVYPDCYFTLSGTTTIGYMVEWLKVPTQGQYKPLIKK